MSRCVCTYFPCDINNPPESERYSRGKMNFKCRQEISAAKDKLVTFSWLYASSSIIGLSLVGCYRPCVLISAPHNHFSPHTHTHTSAMMILFIIIHIYSQQLANRGPTPSNSMPLSFPLLSPFLCASALVISRYI